jgi:hypothetical protein
MVAIPNQSMNDFEPLPSRHLFGEFIAQESEDMLLIKIPLLRLVIRNDVKFAEACKPEMSVLFVRVFD